MRLTGLAARHEKHGALTLDRTWLAQFSTLFLLTCRSYLITPVQISLPLAGNYGDWRASVADCASAPSPTLSLLAFSMHNITLPFLTSSLYALYHPLLPC